ncbi:MAG: hypothetical protein KA329_08025 [Novosphingobium sp.]|nr:hypothetical protein [Novosphingobium sp.]
MTDKPEKPEKDAKPSWTGKAALAGAAIGSAALAGALLYASHRKERAEKAKAKPNPAVAPETD